MLLVTIVFVPLSSCFLPFRYIRERCWLFFFYCAESFRSRIYEARFQRWLSARDIGSLCVHARARIDLYLRYRQNAWHKCIASFFLLARSSSLLIEIEGSYIESRPKNDGKVAGIVQEKIIIRIIYIQTVQSRRIIYTAWIIDLWFA